jgi:beta-N-acetylhexosaminidase
VGGIIYYNWSNGLHSPQQIQQLSGSLQKLVESNRIPIPLFIAVDQEGGTVTRLRKGFTLFPDNQALGMTENPSLAESNAFVMGRELLAVGVNMNLAPVVDVNSNPKNPVIGSRAFGDSAEVVIRFARKALEGYHRAGIITSIKHFPGHGDVEVDSHKELPILKKSKEDLQKTDLLPFAELANETDTVMTAHVIVPSLDPENCITLSENGLNILRHDIGFKGIILSDSLVMEAILKNCSSVDEAAIRAINAGCDLLILGGKQLIETHADLELTVDDICRIHKKLVDAVHSGRIKEERLNQAMQRILDLKKYYLSID